MLSTALFWIAFCQYLGFTAAALVILLKEDEPKIDSAPWVWLLALVALAALARYVGH